MGIDEAGRGCAIGPLVIAGFMVPSDGYDAMVRELIRLGVKDSKQVSPGMREGIVPVIKKLAAAYKVVKLYPPEIDRESINALEARHSARIIRSLEPSRVYIDVPSHGAGKETYCNAVLSFCRHSPLEIIGDNHLDERNFLVAAASLLAKSERERHILWLKRRYGDFGSGYPGDPATKAWLISWLRKRRLLPVIVRHKWKMRLV